MRNPFRRSLLTQLIGYFSLLSVVTVSFVAFTAYNRARLALQEAAFDRLQVAVSLRELELRHWFNNQRQDTLLLAATPGVIEAVSNLSNPDDASAAAETLNRYFAEVLDLKSNLAAISILSPGGIVEISSDPVRIGRYVGLGNTITFFTRDQRTVVPTFYASPDTDLTTVSLAVPIAIPSEGRPPSLAVDLDLQVIDEIIRERTGLGETGQTYLVGRNANRFEFVTSGATGRSQDNITSEGISTAMQGLNGQGIYSSYNGVMVLGVYRWLPAQNLALLAEVSREEAFRPARHLAQQIIIIGFITAAGLQVVVYWVARRIARPILKITDAANLLEDETFKVEQCEALLATVEKRPDELGKLARTFLVMVNKIYKREQKLKQQVAKLQIEIDQAKRSQAVSEITDTEYFRDLQSKAQAMRRKNRGEDT